MKRSNLEKLKRDFDGKPDKLRLAYDAAGIELAELTEAGINKQNQERTEFLLDLRDYAESPAGEDPRNYAGQPGDEHPGMSSDEANFRFGEFLQAVYCASPGVEAGRKIGRFETGRVYSPELRSPTGLAESTPSLGGFLVADDMSRELFQKTYQATSVWKKCRQFRISSRANSIKIPGIEETSRADGSRQGGVRAYWLEEAGTKTASKPTFYECQLSLKKLIGLAYATDELLDDASILAEVVTTAFENEFSFKLDDSVIRGTGSGQPLGVLNGPSLVSTTRASASTICSTDVLNVYARMYSGGHGKAEWFANAECLPNLMSMTAAEAGYQAIWLPADKLAGSPYQTLLGRPIHYIETASAEGTVGDLMFLDLSQYAVATKGGIQQATSIHVNFTTDETAFRFVLRIDGQPLWNSAVTPYKGSDTVSPFVTVAT